MSFKPGFLRDNGVTSQSLLLRLLAHGSICPDTLTGQCAQLSGCVSGISALWNKCCGSKIKTMNCDSIEICLVVYYFSCLLCLASRATIYAYSYYRCKNSASLIGYMGRDCIQALGYHIIKTNFESLKLCGWILCSL